MKMTRLQDTSLLEELCLRQIYFFLFPSKFALQLVLALLFHDGIAESHLILLCSKW